MDREVIFIVIFKQKFVYQDIKGVSNKKSMYMK